MDLATQAVVDPGSLTFQKCFFFKDTEYEGWNWLVNQIDLKSTETELEISDKMTTSLSSFSLLQMNQINYLTEVTMGNYLNGKRNESV